MNWDALGAIAELAGALSVLGTLIYLAKQIKDNSKLLSTSIYETAMEGYNNINKWSIGDPDLVLLTHRMFVENEEEMTPIDKFRVDMIHRIYANHIYINSIACTKKVCCMKKNGKTRDSRQSRSGRAPRLVGTSCVIITFLTICGKGLKNWVTKRCRALISDHQLILEFLV